MEIPKPDPPLADGIVGLRPWCVEDAPVLARAWADPAIRRWCSVTADATVEGAERWIAGADGCRQDGLALDLAIETDGRRRRRGRPRPHPVGPRAGRRRLLDRRRAPPPQPGRQGPEAAGHLGPAPSSPWTRWPPRRLGEPRQRLDPRGRRLHPRHRTPPQTSLDPPPLTVLVAISRARPAIAQPERDRRRCGSDIPELHDPAPERDVGGPRRSTARRARVHA